MTATGVPLDVLGSGQWIAPKKLKTLTLINQSGGPVSWYKNDETSRVSIGNNISVEFEEDEAKDVRNLGFISGPVNGTVLVVWE